MAEKNKRKGKNVKNTEIFPLDRHFQDETKHICLVTNIRNYFHEFLVYYIYIYCYM